MAALTQRLPWLLAGATIGLEVPYPLVDGVVRNALTVAAVLTFTAASLTHAAATRGVVWALTLGGTAVAVGFAAEAIGTRTGVPFGRYAYDASLGPRLAGVPLVIPLAWAMVAYPALLVGRRVATSRVGRALAAGAALASWDLFLDPQMVAAGHWRWADARVTLPGVPHVPVSNYLGWFAVSVLLMALLDRLLADRAAPEGVPLTLYGWTYASSVLANLAFFGRPWVALWGGLGMGAVVALWLRATLRW